MRLFDTFTALGLAATALATGKSAADDTFHESLTLHPLPDGKLSVLFQFTTHFSLHNNADGERIGQWLEAFMYSPQLTDRGITSLVDAAKSPASAGTERGL